MGSSGVNGQLTKQSEKIACMFVHHLIDRGYQFTYRLVDIAAGYGHFEIMKDLIERAHVLPSSEGLYWANYHRHRDVVRYLEQK